MLQAAGSQRWGRAPAVAASHAQPAKLTPRQRRLQKQKRQYDRQRQQQQLQQPAPPPAPPPLPPSGGRPHQGLGTADAAAALQLECEHFGSCSGCTLNTQLDQPPVLADAQHFFAELGLPRFRLHAGSSRRWRRRARLAVRRGADGQPAIGLFEEGSHSVMPIPACT